MCTALLQSYYCVMLFGGSFMVFQDLSGVGSDFPTSAAQDIET